MASKSILLQVDEKATQALADSAQALLDAAGALTEAQSASAAAQGAVSTQTRMYWGDALGAGNVTAADLKASVTKPLIISSGGGANIGPISYSQMTSANYTVNQAQGWSEIIHLINLTGGVLSITLENASAVPQTLQIDGGAGPNGEGVAIWYNPNSNAWVMGPSAL